MLKHLFIEINFTFPIDLFSSYFNLLYNSPCCGWILFSLLILFETLFKPRQLHLAVGMVTDFVSSIHNLKTVF
ncbi:hypothetical protein EQH34_00835 [Streptococcus pneumoniae]|nr:hypothetical protein [Streptococcus pneumoniae]UKP15292.1 hypothetical protein EQH46_00800 [Streptococcus pneumoniae]UKP17354.1 hypothetical protein EQH45_01020 [Streptococcus pneumoniae]UKP37314.1 hypothetical protein EQH34_00835 [Streptococcus pneumoniae]UKP39239.1 hypothetical protein EQH33_00835 [Streptococcus pneumoniae]